jgi:gliding motility-associated-like protein
MVEITPGNFDYKYSWTGPNGFISNNKNLNNIPAGNYQLTVTDNSGFKKTFSVEITESAEILFSSVITPITCYGDNNASMRINVSGGVPPYQINWDNFLTGSFHDNLSAGNYTVTITDANFCEKTIKENIPEAEIFRINSEIKHVSCYGANNGRIALNFEGGKEPITFGWTDNPNAGSTRNNIGPGTYTVNIAEGGGCIISKTFTIVEPMPLTLTASISSVFDCNIDNGGAIDLSVTGGVPPYKYSWSNGAKTKDLSKIPAGNYLVTVTDSVGCSQSVQYTVNRPPSISINVIPKIEYCNTDLITAIYTAVVSGGVPPYQLTWSMGKVSGIHNEKMETDQNGTVVVNVIDNSNCSASKTFQSKIPKLGINDSLLNCNQRKYQFNALVANEESEFYEYKWDFGDGTNSTIRNPEHIFQSTGIFKVLLTATNHTSPCVSVYEQIIKVEPRPDVKIIGPENFCEGKSIDLFTTGADSYKWGNNSSGSMINIERPGIYSVTGFTKAGCTNSDSHSVSYFENFDYKIETDKKEISKGQNTVNFNTRNVSDSYYSWDFGDNNRIDLMQNMYNPSHDYQIIGDGYFNVKLEVINPYGCIEKDSAQIRVNLTSIPNTFTPNGDGTNDFYLEGWNKKIFNRNGVLIFEGTKAWDGNYKGKPVANDTYFVIVYDSAESGSTYRTNYVTVLR